MTAHRSARCMDAALRFVLGTLAAATGAAVVCILYARTSGVPNAVRERILDRASRGVYVLDARDLRLEGFDELVLERMRLFRKYRIGPAVLEADRVRLRVDPVALLAGRSWIRMLHVEDAVLRPDVLRSDAPSPDPAVPGKHRSFDVHLERLRVAGVHIDDLTGRYESGDLAHKLSQVTAVLSRDGIGGSLSGEVTVDAGAEEMNLTLASSMDPNLLRPFLESLGLNGVTSVLGEFEFGDRPPTCEMQLFQQLRAGGESRLRGRFWMENGRFRAVEILRADGTIEYDRKNGADRFTMAPLVVVRPEGVARGRFTVQPGREMVEFEAHSTLHPAALSRMIGVLTNEVQTFCRFEGPVTMRGGGRVDYGRKQDTDFEIRAEIRDGGVARVRAGRIFGHCRMTGTTVTVSEVRGELYGGAFEGDAEIVVADTPDAHARYAVRVRLTGARTAEAADVLVGEGQHDYQGRLSGRLELQGLAGEGMGRTAQGNGMLSSIGGRVFALPLFGGLSDYLSRIVPGLDFVLRQTDLKAEFTISDGRVHSKQVLIEGDVLSLRGEGAVFFDQRLDFHVQIALLKAHTLAGRIIRLPTYLLSKLFEFRLRGTWSDPVWYPANFSLDVLDRLRTDGREGGRSRMKPQVEEEEEEEDR